MRPSARVVAGVVVVLLLLAPAAARSQPVPEVPPGCELGVLPSLALSLICVPPVWNGQLVVYAPGYTPPQLPLGFYQLTTPDGTLLPQLVQSLGYAFATTSYRKNGLAILQGVEDVRLLLAAFTARVGAPLRTHMTGVSEGGLVATLLAERSPHLFSSALAACAPIGSFRQQINYLGDFRVLFDYFFPGVIPGSPIDVPAGVIANWFTVYVPAVQGAMAANPTRALELMRVSHVAFDPADLTTVVRSALNVLAYNIFGTADAKATLGDGNPYGNRFRWYFGSSNDLRLNLSVRRFDASPVALAAMRPYETNGDLRIPLVTIHTTADEIAPVAHELLYWPKVDLEARGRFVPIPVARYGHCNFTATEIGLSFLYAAGLP